MKVKDLFNRLFWKTKEEPRVEVQEEASRKRVEPVSAKQPSLAKVRKFDEEHLTQVILGPKISEKSMQNWDQNLRVFEVARGVTRDEVKSAVELMFEAKVSTVRMVNVRGKVKRNGRRKHWCKAYVQLAPGQTLEGMELGT